MSRLPPALRIHFEVQYVGRMIKAAKRRVTFKFAFAGDSDEHSVVLNHTINSGKKVVFLNGNEIFEEEKLGVGEFVYPFQLQDYLGNQHLLTIIVAAQVSDEGMYDLRIDGRSFMDLRLTTLMDLRSRARDKDSSAVWSRGGAVAGQASEAPSYDHGASEEHAVSRQAGGGRAHTRGRAAEEEEPKVQAISLSDFVGGSVASGGAPAAAPSGGAWDPFTSGGGAGGGGDGFDEPAPAPAPAALPKPAAASASHAAPLRAPRAAAPASSSVAAVAFDPFSDAPPAAAPAAAGGARRPSAGPSAGVGSLVDDLAGLSFGGGAPSRGAASVPAPSADPFGDAFSAPAPKAPAGGLDDLFGAPAPAPAAASSSFPPAGSHVAAPSLGNGAGLVDLDNLTAPKAAPAAQSKPSLAQLAQQKPGVAAGKNVMGAGLSGGSASAAVTLGALDFGLGMGGMSGMGAGGAMPAAGGMGMGGMGFGAPMAAPSKPAPSSSAAFNPFDM